MVISSALLFPSPKGNVSEESIRTIEETLTRYGVSHTRDAEGDFDAIIALGGDGTMLNASRLAFRKRVPIICINFGTLGYMSGLENSELELLSALSRGFETEKRMLISISVERDGRTVAESTALNEAVVTRKADGDIANIDLLCDGGLVCNYRADGIIIATPTGSSAYAMSAGGPIIDTKLDAMCICPVCPHSLGARAMVFSPNSYLDAVCKNTKENNLVLISDGILICELCENDRVTVKRSELSLELIKLKRDAFYETLYNKMS